MQVALEVKQDEGMYLKTELASGEFNGEEFSVCSTVGGLNLLLMYRSKQYVLRIAGVIKPILESIDGEQQTEDE